MSLSGILNATHGCGFICHGKSMESYGPCPSLHVIPYPLLSSLLHLLCKAALKDTNKQGTT